MPSTAPICSSGNWWPSAARIWARLISRDGCKPLEQSASTALRSDLDKWTSIRCMALIYGPLLTCQHTSSQPIGTLKPPPSHPRATPEPPSSHPRATLKPPPSHPQATLKLPRGSGTARLETAMPGQFAVSHPTEATLKRGVNESASVWAQKMALPLQLFQGRVAVLVIRRLIGFGAEDLPGAGVLPVVIGAGGSVNLGASGVVVEALVAEHRVAALLG